MVTVLPPELVSVNVWAAGDSPPQGLAPKSSMLCGQPVMTPGGDASKPEVSRTPPSTAAASTGDTDKGLSACPASLIAIGVSGPSGTSGDGAKSSLRPMSLPAWGRSGCTGVSAATSSSLGDSTSAPGVGKSVMAPSRSGGPASLPWGAWSANRSLDVSRPPSSR